MHGTRSCTACNIEFTKDSIKQVKCKPCKRAYDREYHATRPPANRARRLALQEERKTIARQFIWNYFSENPCVICGEADPIVLEFDHIDQTTKSSNVSEMLCNSIETITEEINKCRVLCANCHRRHTAVQLGWYKDLTR